MKSFDELQYSVMVSIIMVAYNHEKYISQAIDSIIMQKTKYSYELIVAEDCSTDKTRKIIEKYTKEYPFIKPIYQNRNIGAEKNGYTATRQAKGKYVAFLDGDDFWLDENKIQLQVDFLEKNKNYVGIAHNVLIVDQAGIKRKELMDKKITGKRTHIFSLEEAKKESMLAQIGSVLCRNIFYAMTQREAFLFYNCLENGDVKVMMTLACCGDVFFFEKIVSAYRKIIKNGENWNSYIAGKNTSWIYYRNFKSLMEYTEKAFNIDTYNDNRLLGQVYGAWLFLKKKPSKENLQIFRKIFNDGYFNKIFIIKYLLYKEFKLHY